MTSEHGGDAPRTSDFDRPGRPTFGPPPPGPGQGPHGQPYFGGPQYQQPVKKRQTTVIVLIALIAVVALALVGVIAALLLTSSGGKAESVLANCAEQVPDADSADLTSDERSITYSTGPYPDSSDIELLECLLEETSAPSAVQARMESTRALDGTQDFEWDDWSAFWTYHPDNGIDATFTVK